ncbi:hypothetical protein [Streptomyces sp. NPDC056227]|uniref:hypothetical protein n=1 Tax=Streptomyces sp. NPDC056227 TaxID=3345753 RepID=UPI0035DDF9DA
MAKLAATVYVTDPDTNQTVILEAGTSPEARLAALVTNPAAWDGKVSDTAPAEPEPEGDDDADTKQAARKTAAKRPARGRTTAAEGTSGQ